MFNLPVNNQACCTESKLANTLLSVVAPVYNEEQTILTVLDQVVTHYSHAQVIIVNDGSSDGTLKQLEEWGNSRIANATVLSHSGNQGKGAAIRTAIPHAIGKFTIIQDADLEYNPADYSPVLEPLISERSLIVYGSRFMPGSITNGVGGTVSRFGVRLLNLVARLLYGCRLTDLATCYKAFPTELLRQMDLQCQGFEFCAEVTAKACRMKIPIHEVPIEYTPRTTREGKKIRWWHGLSMLIALWKYRNWYPQPPSVESTD